MTTMTRRRRRTADTNHNSNPTFLNSNPTFLQVALRPYRRGLPERHSMINILTIQEVTPPSASYSTNPATGETIKVSVPDHRYMVTFKEGHGQQEYGRATRADLVAAGIPLPPGWS